MTPSETLRQRAEALGLHGLLRDWDEIGHEPWVEPLLGREESARAERSLARRLQRSRLGRFKAMEDFDWSFPKSIDRDQIEDLLGRLDWIDPPTNLILVGPNGVGKTMIAQNLAHQALLQGATVQMLSASALLNDLAAQDSASALQKRIAHYLRPRVLLIDELGYLSYDHRHADLLFELVTRRHLHKPILITTNRAFGEWNETFPSATSVVTLVDRLVHRSEIIRIEGDSYRNKEAKLLAAERARRRAERREARETKR